MVTLVSLALRGETSPHLAAVERIRINNNRSASGTLTGGVLTVHLDAREGEWFPEGDSTGGIVVRAFGADGGPLQVPGPLLRVAKGTEIHAFVHNSIRGERLVLHGLNTRGSQDGANDTVSVGSGEEREIRFTASEVGTFYYWAASNTARAIAARVSMDTELSGAFVVDPAVGPPPADRIFLVSFWTRSGTVDTTTTVIRVAVNGKVWPHTERLAYTVGDTARIRVINAGGGAHPMHLHGFYYRVDSRGNEQASADLSRDPAPYMVNTERLTTGLTMSMTWVPTRPGNWLFHCHDPVHVARNLRLDGLPFPARTTHEHDMEEMGGPVLGVTVAPVRGGARIASEPAARRRLRIVASADTGATVAEPSYSYVLDDGRKFLPHSHRAGPTLVLQRGEPVSITVVNRLTQPTSVHWHGIELDAYYDGVPGFSGHPGHLTPQIAPGDSFVARFTPPRSGTFMYHPHISEIEQQRAGLDGALLVVDAPAAWDSTTDLAFVLTTPRLEAEQNLAVYINGTGTPAERELRSGRTYRVRLMNLHNFRPGLITKIMRGSEVLSWRWLAKDGLDVPASRATMRPASQQMGNGETYDFEFVAPDAGALHLDVTSGLGVLLASMPLRVR
ncbi:MAG: multicopper oxidase domain-containing protein [Gemmatimonadaceae bacterium]